MPRETKEQEEERGRKALEFWRETFGHWPPTREEVEAELIDYKMLIDNATRVYVEVTGGAVSKLNTDAEPIVGLYQEQLDKAYEEGYKDAKEAFGQ